MKKIIMFCLFTIIVSKVSHSFALDFEEKGLVSGSSSYVEEDLSSQGVTFSDLVRIADRRRSNQLDSVDALTIKILRLERLIRSSQLSAHDNSVAHRNLSGEVGTLRREVGDMDQRVGSLISYTDGFCNHCKTVTVASLVSLSVGLAAGY